MLHYTCDACGVRLDEKRYVVKVEIAPAGENPMISEEDLDADHLEEIAELLDAGAQPHDDGPQGFRFDLCPKCRETYCHDPLGKDSRHRLKFSQN